MRPIDIGILIVVAILLLLALRSAIRHYTGKGGGCCGCSGGSCGSCCSDGNAGARGEDLSKKAVTAGTPSKIMRIEGMHCANCKKSVEKALTAQNGVIRADADVDRGIARVFYENGVDDAKLQEAVEKNDFPGMRRYADADPVIAAAAVCRAEMEPALDDLNPF